MMFPSYLNGVGLLTGLSGCKNDSNEKMTISRIPLTLTKKGYKWGGAGGGVGWGVGGERT